MKNYTHESEILNSLLGKRVEITFFDNKITSGILQRSSYHFNCYHIEGDKSIDFRKTHVKKIEKK